MLNLIPMPASINPSAGEFTLSRTTKIFATDGKTLAIGKLLASYIEQHTQLQPAVVVDDQSQGNIHLKLISDPNLGEEGYELVIQTDSIYVTANQPAGLFYGIQTLRQLISAHHSTTSTRLSTSLKLPAVSIQDSPHFSWRGAMLDVARHFFRVEDVKRYIDLISHYKINRLHLHLTDDQGWRIEIKAWPKLTEVGAQTQVNGNGGGFYTQEQYKATS